MTGSRTGTGPGPGPKTFSACLWSSAIVAPRFWDVWGAKFLRLQSELYAKHSLQCNCKGSKPNKGKKLLKNASEVNRPKVWMRNILKKLSHKPLFLKLLSCWSCSYLLSVRNCSIEAKLKPAHGQDLVVLMLAAGEVWWFSCLPPARFGDFHVRPHRGLVIFMSATGEFWWFSCPPPARFGDFHVRRRWGLVIFMFAASELVLLCN